MFAYLKCLFSGGHLYGRWWFVDTPSATYRECEACGVMQKPRNRKDRLFRSGKSAHSHIVIKQDGGKQVFLTGTVAYGKGCEPAGGHKPETTIEFK